MILWKLIIKRSYWITFLTLCFAYQKRFGAFPVFHLIIRLFKIAKHNHIAKLFTHIFSLCRKDCGGPSSLYLYQPAMVTSPLGGYHFTWDLGKKETLLPFCSRFISPPPSRRCFHPCPILLWWGRDLSLTTTFFGYLPVCSSHDFCYAACHSFHKGSRNASVHKHTYVHPLLS